jgi:hypothetical protein
LADYASKSRDQFLRFKRRGRLLGMVAEERLEIRGVSTATDFTFGNSWLSDTTRELLGTEKITWHTCILYK